jgi:hypothetical protein
VKDWLIGNMGIYGEYQYQAIHLISTAVVLLFLLAALYLGGSKRIGREAKERTLRIICWFQLAFEIFWRVIYVTVKGDDFLCWWPLYPCNLGGILIPIIGLTDWRRGKALFYLFGFIGGVLTFALPEGIFVRDVLVFPILKSILQHTGLLLIPGLEFAMGKWRPQLRKLGWTVIGCMIHVVNCEGITRLLGFTGDYMFFRSGLPFVIPGIPQYITLSVFALLVLALISWICDLTCKGK